jgi:phage repressor protein C with HTH and peptisase S24 domain
MLDQDELARRLKAAITAAPISQEAIAEEFGVTPQAVSGWIRTGKIGKDKLPRLASLLGRELSFFMPDAEQAQEDETEWPNILGYSQAVGLGNGVEAVEYAETHKLKFRARSLAKKGLFPENLAVMYGAGDSMLPRIKAGDAILFDTTDVRPRHNGIFVVRMGREIFAKRCLLLDDLVYFDSINPNGDHRWNRPRRMDSSKEPIEIVGRVRWIGSWED